MITAVSKVMTRYAKTSPFRDITCLRIPCEWDLQKLPRKPSTQLLVVRVARQEGIATTVCDSLHQTRLATFFLMSFLHDVQASRDSYVRLQPGLGYHTDPALKRKSAATEL